VRISRIKPLLRRVQLFLLALAFTSLSIAGQTLAVDKDFFAGNDILFYDPTCAYTGGSTTLEGNGIKEKIWNFLIQNGLNDVQAAGVMGNMQAESGFIPTRFQGDTSFDPWNSARNHAWGLVQWDSGRRYTAPDKGVLGKLKEKKPELVKYVDNKYNWFKDKSIQAKIPATDLDALMSFELDYLLQESKSRPVTAKGFGDANNEWNTMKLQKNIEDATVFWHNNFEVSSDSASEVLANRGGAAKDIYQQFSGKTTTSSGSSSSSSSSSSSAGSATAPTIFIDPGHGGAIAPYIDQQSGLKTSESHNMPESADVLDVANRVKTALEGAGYKVALARTTNDQQVKFRDRANAAASANASLGVSIHTTPGDINQAWPQRLGTYRQYGSHKDTFNEKDTAQKSEAFANIFAKTRTASEGHTVTTDPGNVQEAKSFGGSRNDIDSKGNTPLIELWSPKVPWVYNEIGQDKGTAISDALKQKYADGIIKGVEESIPYTKTDQCGNAAAVSGDLAKTIFSYAWPDYHAAPYTTKKPEYDAAVKKAQSEHRYVGGGIYPGIDCGGFVTTVMIDSGFEPKYNSSGKGGNVVSQHDWATKNWQKVGDGSSIDVAKLQQGDVAYSSDLGHTFIYAGTIPNFHSKIASASYSTTGQSWRTPMAGHESPTGGVTWYRKK